MSSIAISLLVVSIMTPLCLMKMMGQHTSPLMILIMIEILSVSAILLLVTISSYKHQSIMSSIYLLIMIILEATLGLTILINLTRQTVTMSPLSKMMAM